jgi:N-acetylglucosamine-6-phosphate deacetylase
MQGIHSIHLVLLDRVLEDAWITFEDGIIKAFGQREQPAAVDWLDGERLYVAPGLIDLHVHGGNGADALDGTPEAFRTIADYHLAHGTTSLCPTLISTTYDRIANALDAWESARTGLKARLLPLHLEGPHFARTKAGAHDPELLHAATDEEIDWLVERAAGISQMTVAPEMPNALELIERGSKAGIVMSAGHTEAREEHMRPALEAGLRKVTHLYNAMTFAEKRGLFRIAGLAEYALTEDRLSCEIIADGVHVEPVLLKLAYQSKGAGRLALISDALAGTGLPVGSEFALGTLRAKVGERYCLLANGSALAGSATRMMDQVRIMTKSVGVPLHEAIRMATHTPARLIGRDGYLGAIVSGHAADLVRFDANFRVHDVWVGGLPHAAGSQQGLAG